MREQRLYNGMTGEQRRTERRARLLRVARDLLADGGSRALTVTAVCQAARLSERYFYESFANRDELIDAIFADLVDVVSGAFVAVSSSEDDPWARARAVVDALVDLMLSDPRLSKLAMEAKSDDVVMRGRALTARGVAETIVQHASLFWPVPPGQETAAQLAAELAIGGMADVLVAWHVGRLDCSRAEMVDRTATMFMVIGDALIGHEIRPHGAALPPA